jgi:hypothetical protein
VTCTSKCTGAAKAAVTVVNTSAAAVAARQMDDWIFLTTPTPFVAFPSSDSTDVTEKQQQLCQDNFFFEINGLKMIASDCAEYL